MKKLWKMLLLAGVFTVLLCGSALAEGELGAGFYGIGSATDVTIEARTEGNTKATATSAQVGGKAVTYYEGAARLFVDYTGAMDDADQFVVLLVSDNGSKSSENIITESTVIHYIDQLSGKKLKSGNFDVYPILPTEKATNTPMTLYITSNRAGFKTIKISLNYATAGTYQVAPYKLGDIDNDGVFTAADAMSVLQMAVGLGSDWTETQRLAANVDGDEIITAADSMRILQRAVGLISEF